MSIRWSIQIKKIGSAYIYIHIYHIYPIHILYTLRWWFHLGSAYLHINVVCSIVLHWKCTCRAENSALVLVSSWNCTWLRNCHENDQCPLRKQALSLSGHSENHTSNFLAQQGCQPPYQHGGWGHGLWAVSHEGHVGDYFFWPNMAATQVETPTQLRGGNMSLSYISWFGIQCI